MLRYELLVGWHMEVQRLVFQGGGPTGDVAILKHELFSTDLLNRPKDGMQITSSLSPLIC